MIRGALKKILSRRLIERLQALATELDIVLASLASHSGVTSALYYGVFSGQFRREMRSVLVARRRYHRSRAGHSPAIFLLRRNIHRLEKGLIMRPRRQVFGEAYIGETVDNLTRCIDASALSESELAWSRDVIAEYFSVVGSTDTIEAARSAFFTTLRGLQSPSNDEGHRPLTYASLGEPGLALEDLRALCQRRHSVRWFQGKRVPRHLIDMAVDVAATAPSACNRQPFTFHVFDEPARAQQIGAIPMGTAGFSGNFQCTVVVVGDLSAYPFEKDRHIIYIDSALAVMQLQLALETLGLGSCSINWPDIERHEREMARQLGLELHQRPVMLLAVGYPDPDAQVPFSAKKTSKELVVWPR